MIFFFTSHLSYVYGWITLPWLIYNCVIGTTPKKQTFTFSNYLPATDTNEWANNKYSDNDNNDSKNVDKVYNNCMLLSRHIYASEWI